MGVDWGPLIAICNETFGDAFLLADSTGAPILDLEGSPVSITGVFDDAYKRDIILESGEVEWTTLAPVLGIDLSTWPVAPTQGMYLTNVATGIRYVLVDSRPDGKGWAKLVLGRAT